MERPEPDIWRDLAALLAVGEAQSSFAAARALGISHTAIATRIDQLEARMGSVLVKRSGPRWELTSAGQGLAQKARGIAELVERSGRAQAGEQPLVMSCPELFFEYLLLPVWYRIQRELPAHVSQPLHLRTARRVTDQMTEGNDLTLCIARELQPGVQGAEVGKVSFRLFAHRSLFSKDLDEAPCHFTVDNPQLAVPDLVWPQLGTTRRVTCANLSMVAAAVKAGQGIGLLPSFITQQDRALVPLDGVALEPFSLWILSQAKSADPIRVAGLRQLLLREISPLLAERPIVRH